jgi:hypothetical protein
MAFFSRPIRKYRENSLKPNPGELAFRGFRRHKALKAMVFWPETSLYI